MKYSFYTKVKVGITTIIALAVLISGVLWVKEFNPATNKIRFTVVFNNGERIAQGDPITLSGIKVGEISGVSLTKDNKAAITLYITKSIDLPEDCTFIIEDVGLMGDKALVIIPGTSTVMIDPEKIYYGTDASGMNALIDKAGAVLTKLNSIGDKLDKNLDISKLSDSFELTFEKIQLALKEYEQIARENRDPLRESINNFNTASQDVKNFIAESDSKLIDAIDGFQKTTDKISLALDDMKSISSLIDTVTTYMESGEGTFARLVKSDELYEELRNTNANLDSFVTDFKKNPGKYTKDMNFKIRLF
ncbi:MAG: MCE family protein [Candidatus Latescibacteria bacterium]|nr:MCE family protein [Candidatus Latescibacterota bacterium]